MNPSCCSKLRAQVLVGFFLLWTLAPPLSAQVPALCASQAVDFCSNCCSKVDKWIQGICRGMCESSVSYGPKCPECDIACPIRQSAGHGCDPQSKCQPAEIALGLVSDPELPSVDRACREAGRYCENRLPKQCTTSALQDPQCQEARRDICKKARELCSLVGHDSCLDVAYQALDGCQCCLEAGVQKSSQMGEGMAEDALTTPKSISQPDLSPSSIPNPKTTETH